MEKSNTSHVSEYNRNHSQWCCFCFDCIVYSWFYRWFYHLSQNYMSENKNKPKNNNHTQLFEEPVCMVEVKREKAKNCIGVSRFVVDVVRHWGASLFWCYRKGAHYNGWGWFPGLQWGVKIKDIFWSGQCLWDYPLCDFTVKYRQPYFLFHGQTLV